jgi:hypothetical protein
MVSLSSLKVCVTSEFVLNFDKYSLEQPWLPHFSQLGVFVYGGLVNWGERDGRELGSSEAFKGVRGLKK